MCGTAKLLMSEDDYQQLGLCSHRLGPGDRAQVGRLGGKRLDLLSHLTGPHQPHLNYKDALTRIELLPLWVGGVVVHLANSCVILLSHRWVAKGKQFKLFLSHRE